MTLVLWLLLLDGGSLQVGVTVHRPAYREKSHEAGDVHELAEFLAFSCVERTQSWSIGQLGKVVFPQSDSQHKAVKPISSF